MEHESPTYATMMMITIGTVCTVVAHTCTHVYVMYYEGRRKKTIVFVQVKTDGQEINFPYEIKVRENAENLLFFLVQ